MGLGRGPARRLIFARDVPRLPRALPRYLPADADRALTAALHASPNPLSASALLLLRATGMRIGELLDLELDCVHEVPGAGAWLKVPLGKLDTERMVPIDEEGLALVDQITEHRSPGRPLPHPRTGKLADFLLTHQGRRVSADTLRSELHRAADQAGIGAATPHQLRHTYAPPSYAGIGGPAIALLLGHESLASTCPYLHADLELKQRALDRTAPPPPAAAGTYPKTNCSRSSRPCDYAELCGQVTAPSQRKHPRPARTSA